MSSANTARPTTLRLLKKIVCPNCWVETRPNKLLWVSQHTDLLGDPRLGDDEQQRFLPTRFSIRGNALDARSSECFDMACPNCHLQVPRHLLELPVHFMSIFGSRSSGKTCYLASLTHQLRQALPLDFRISFQDTDPASNTRIRENESRLFDSEEPDVPSIVGNLIDKTQEQGIERGINLVRQVHFGGSDVRDFPQPFMFTLQLNNDHHLKESRSQFGRILCLYDNAGESFIPGADSETQTRHLSRSQMLLFTFDPTQDPRLQKLIREKSPGRLSKNPTQLPQEPLFQEAAKRIKQYAGLSLRDRHAAPLIVVTTKFDIWSDLIGDFNRGVSPWRQVRVSGADDGNGQVAMAIDQPVIDDMSSKVRRLLMKTSPEIIAAAETLADNVKYVPVSAIGWDNAAVELPDGQPNYQLKPADTKPFWVEVPVVYGISQSLPGLVPIIKA